MTQKSLHFFGPYNFLKGNASLFHSKYSQDEGIYLWVIKDIYNNPVMPFDKLTTHPDTQTHYLTSSFDRRRGIRKGGHPALFSREGERGSEFNKNKYID